jgi:iron-sulfur cluster protein
MKPSELTIMNRSFGILERRRLPLLHEVETKRLKEKVVDIRKKSVEDLPILLATAVQNLEENGVEVYQAADSKEACKVILQVLNGEPIVAKSKSNTAGEIGLTEYLEENGINVVETDLGDRIVQLHKKSRPSHPIGPAAHLDMKTIAEIVSNSLKVEVEPEPRSILEHVKKDILNQLQHTRVGITGANSVAAEDGGLLMVHNEGNISLLTMLDIHIIIVGIDKLVPTLEEAISVVKLETRYATGKKAPAYMNVVTSPSKTADIEQILLKDMYGPHRVIVVFLDNGRKKARLAAPETLWCIGCGSCVVNCPVYNVTGPEFGYKRNLGGRGIILSRYIEDPETAFLSGLYDCTLCGECSLECPVDIPIPELVEKLRSECVSEGISQEKHRIIRDKIRKNGSPFNSK